MEKKIKELIKEDSDQAKEYLDSMKASVSDGSYFKDAVNWYFFKYVTPICDRTLLIFGAILATVVIYFLYQMMQSAFPLVEKMPIFIKSKDQSLYFPNLVELKPKENESGYDPNIATVDEAVAKYLLANYVKERESFDFSDANIEDVNNKFNRIRNTSSSEQYKAFQLFMSKGNPTSPIRFFGKDVYREVTIESVKMIKEESDNLAIRAKNFIYSQIPTQAQVRFISNTITRNPQDGTNIEQKERFVAKINFKFAGISREETSLLNFTVNGYQLYRIR